MSTKQYFIYFLNYWKIVTNLVTITLIPGSKISSQISFPRTFLQNIDEMITLSPVLCDLDRRVRDLRRGRDREAVAGDDLPQHDPVNSLIFFLS
jgi:hypothetical protein